MKLWFLGTGAGRPSKYRNVTAIALQLPEPSCSWWLFDAGEATQHQLLQLPLKLNKLDVVFVTHLHGDHIYGLPGLLSSRSFDGGVTPVRLFGPKGIKQYIETVFELSGTQLDYELIIHELSEAGGLIYEDDQFTVECGTLEHRVLSYGYRITEADAPGRLQVEKLQAMGLKPGPQYGQLKRGESVTLSDGTTIQPKDVLEPDLPGRIVTLLGDTAPCDNAIYLAREADLLVHEATFAAGMELKAHEFGHSTTVEAASNAKAANARRLVMTHFSGRYRNEDLAKLAEEASAVFPAADAAADLQMIEISRTNRE